MSRRYPRWYHDLNWWGILGLAIIIGGTGFAVWTSSGPERPLWVIVAILLLSTR